MIADLKPLSFMTADDLMARDVVRLPETMPLRDAARLLVQNQVSGAPVVDAEGRCVGVLSSIDVLRLARTREQPANPVAPALPFACSFQRIERDCDLRQFHACTLPKGVCPIQRVHRDSAGHEKVVCSEPHFVLTDWQVVELEKLPTDEVRNFMTAEPVTVLQSAPMSQLARMMVDAHIHRIIVTDAAGKPVGVVSSTDVLAAVAEHMEP
ncbi:MAG: CBS domain-containing protein [Gemmataceae bacterium]